MPSIHQDNKNSLQALMDALYNFEKDHVKKTLLETFAEDASIHLSNPFGELNSVEEFYQEAYLPLFKAIPDLERRNAIFISGEAQQNSCWIGCCGYYTGNFEQDWLDIPATGHQISMRYHEFFRIENQRVVEMQAIWDIPEVMMQAGVWPMSPSLGREWHVPGPASQDGIVTEKWDVSKSEASLKLVNDMLNSLGKYKDGGVAAMELDKYWHPRCSWYGPSGIGTGRGLKGFRNWHQIPFLNGMPNRVGDPAKGYLFADHNYVGFTAWPGMQMTISNDGWLGIAPAMQTISMRSLDFWRCEQGLIRENWVLIDLLHVYEQLGVDVLSRMREMAKRRRPHLMN